MRRSEWCVWCTLMVCPVCPLFKCAGECLDSDDGLSLTRPDLVAKRSRPWNARHAMRKLLVPT